MFFMEPIDETFLQWIDIADDKGGKVNFFKTTCSILDINDGVGGQERHNAVSEEKTRASKSCDNNQEPK